MHLNTIPQTHLRTLSTFANIRNGPKQCGRYGGALNPLMTASAPPISSYWKKCFGMSRDDKTADNDGKKNNAIQT